MGEALARSGGSGHWADTADELVELTVAIQAAVASGEPLAEYARELPLGKELLPLLEAEILNEQAESANASAVSAIEGFLSSLKDIQREIESDERASQPEDQLTGPHASELVAEIAHDLRSPLTSILTLAETLRRGRSGPVNENQRRQIGLIYSAALALSSTASNLIELAQGSDRLAQKEPSPFSVAELLESVRDIVAPLAEEKGVNLQFEVGVDDWRLGYPLALSRVLLNLTSNALKFTESGYISVTTQPADANHVEFSVRDTGRGIDPRAIETLYQPFRRASGRPGFCFSGSGLGLVICRRLLEAMETELKLETRSGWGTRFSFRLKLPTTDQFV